MQRSNTVLDLRDDKLHMWIAESPNDLEIRVKPGREDYVTKLQMSKAPSGHLLLKCTNFQKKQNYFSAGFATQGSRPNAKLAVPGGIAQEG